MSSISNVINEAERLEPIASSSARNQVEMSECDSCTDNHLTDYSGSNNVKTNLFSKPVSNVQQLQSRRCNEIESFSHEECPSLQVDFTRSLLPSTRRRKTSSGKSLSPNKDSSGLFLSSSDPPEHIESSKFSDVKTVLSDKQQQDPDIISNLISENSGITPDTSDDNTKIKEKCHGKSSLDEENPLRENDSVDQQTKQLSCTCRHCNGSENPCCSTLNNDSKLVASLLPSDEPDNNSCECSNSSYSSVISSMSKTCVLAAETASHCFSEAHRKASDAFTAVLKTTISYVFSPVGQSWKSFNQSPFNLNKLLCSGNPFVSVLGVIYDLRNPSQCTRFLEDCFSRVIFTYRTNFEPICSSLYNQRRTRQDNEKQAPEFSNLTINSSSENNRTHDNQDCGKSDNNSPDFNKNDLPFIRRTICEDRFGRLISDAGWGCMIRATQMAVCQALLTLRLGRYWRRYPFASGVPDSNTSCKNAESTGSFNLLSNKKEMCCSSQPISKSIILEMKHNEELGYATSPFVEKNTTATIQTGHDERACSSSKAKETWSYCEKKCLEQEINSSSNTQEAKMNSYTHVSSDKIYSILELFRDTYQAPLSIHNIVLFGEQKLGIPVGNWLGPTGCGQAIEHIMLSDEFKKKFFYDIAPILFSDRVITHSKVYDLWESRLSSGDQNVAILLVVCMRLGTMAFNADRYANPLMVCFRMHQFQGIAGGGSWVSAHYFFGECEQGLLFLDPHQVVQESVCSPFVTGGDCSSTSEGLCKSLPELSQYFLSHSKESSESSTSWLTSEDASLLASSKLCVVPWSSINPSLALYFLCKDKSEYQDLIQQLAQISKDVPELFEMMEYPIDFQTSTHQVLTL